MLYSSASLGVVHDLPSGQQSFFEGHTDDISCLCLAPGALGLVGSGQVGKRPFLCLWDASCALPSPGSSSSSGEHSGFTHPYEVTNWQLVTRHCYAVT